MTVISVGFDVPGDVIEHIPFKSDRSLFDADVTVFSPTFESYKSYESYAGKPLLSSQDSARIAQDCTHWSQEIKEAVEAGKTVFIFLRAPEQVYFYTGEKTYSGTGRSRITTNIVNPVQSYRSIPFSFEELTPRKGNSISILAPLGVLSSYWAEFGSSSAYEVYFAPKKLKPVLGTKGGEKCVGGTISTAKGGLLVFLPMTKWKFSEFTYTRGESTYWRKEAIALGHRFVHALISVAEVVRKGANRTPPPDWTLTSEFSIQEESRITKEISQLDSLISAHAKERDQLQNEAIEAGSLRDLLFETGKPLERAVIKALKLMGFEAENVVEGGSEFDAVFTAREGRFLGEVEGKDSKAINIDKMGQLERNLQEDFSRESVSEYAKGVLFGNAFRLAQPSARPGFFTEKCQAAAKRLSIALIRTPDLFGPARYLSEMQDEKYAEACRATILKTAGDVAVFPELPKPQAVAS